jgi:hypothetical protein
VSNLVVVLEEMEQDIVRLAERAAEGEELPQDTRQVVSNAATNLRAIRNRAIQDLADIFSQLLELPPPPPLQNAISG